MFSDDYNDEPHLLRPGVLYLGRREASRVVCPQGRRGRGRSENQSWAREASSPLEAPDKGLDGLLTGAVERPEVGEQV
jgi:hypothetical protein